MSPLATVLSVLAGIGTLALLFFFGLVFGAIALVVGTALAIYIKLRIWWLRRKGVGTQVRQSAAGQIIEGQYSVVDDEASERTPPQ